MRHAHRALAVLLAGASVFAAHAQTVYKLIDSKGAITYAQSVPKDFRGHVLPLEIDGAAARATLASDRPMDDRAVERFATQRRQALMREARSRVEAARRALSRAAGGMRVSDLERQLEQAREDLFLFEQAGR